MFGFVVANTDILSEEDKHRYKAVYCGLCRSLKQRHGQAGRLSLNYDMTFLVLVLSSLYEPDECRGCERCYVHPMKLHDYVGSKVSDYSADMTVALTYLNQMDNWNDDKNLFSLFHAKLLKGKYRRIAQAYPRQCGAMEECIANLSKLEKTGEADPDVGAKLFGKLMSELFVLKEDHWANNLRAMAGALGEFIYIMDAVYDLEKDAKKHRYNPLILLKQEGRDDEFFLDLLKVIMGECTMEFHKLPLVENVSIMQNILCSGIWAKYEQMQLKKGGKRH